MHLYDCHCHSHHSPDSKSTVREIAEQSISLGLSGVTITDHYNPLSPNYTPEKQLHDISHILKSFDEICDVREEYAGRLELFCGVEIGAPFRHNDSCSELACDSRVDEIIGSVHGIAPIFNDGSTRGYSPYFDEPTECDRLVEAYMTDVYRNAAFCDVDVIGHVTYLERYIIKDGTVLFDVKRFVDACADIMHICINRGKAIEINSKSLTLCDNVPFSELDFFRMYREMGGKLVTVGSDAHTLNGFSQAKQARDLLVAAGFESACYYKNRHPEFYSII